MPPKTSPGGTLPVAAADPDNEVICPLNNQDGSACRKKCVGEKRYRSMQEHIRRAHPDYYIPKLPATEESFQLMISTPPSHRPQPQKQSPAGPATAGPQRRTLLDLGDHDPYSDLTGLDAPSGPLDTQPPAAANAAVALTQLHHWDSDLDVYSDADYRRDHSVIELPSLRAQFHHDTLPPFQPSRPRELLPSILQSPGNRYASLPPVARRDRANRPRKPSMGENARKGKHERGKSRDFSAKEFSRRLSVDGRKAMSAEPPTAAWMQGKRWEDLIEAATSATDVDEDRDLTPPFPSVESLESAGSGQNFHISATGLPASVSSSNDKTSPMQAPHARPYQHSQSSSFGSRAESLEIFCASCGRPWLLRNAFACTECICGVCSDCVGQIISSPVVTVQPGYAPMRRGCPRCGVMGGKWKRFQLDFR
ncbi:hypothetical protein DV737_g1212, partial [Chaetothyriales sp. CBS 132003]